jgi:predicted pyridoxine 5'-phosphate oxidase superfamily flavin-nucleotide-binding protein
VSDEYKNGEPVLPDGQPACRWNGFGSRGERELQREYQTEARAARFYQTQMIDHLNERMREFIGEQEMMFVATADSNGECDATFRAGQPGFIQVFDDKTLAYPEYRGNGVMASLGNISENGHIGLLMIDFIRDQIGLHINGTVEIVSDEAIRASYDLADVRNPGRHGPERWVKVTVVEAYIHCSKHIPRLAKQTRTRQWGTDDPVRKKNNYFETAPRKSA